MSSALRDFALSIVRRLQAANFEALFAGGCVRDERLGIEPSDYDVATSARPEQIRELFGRGRTIPIGESFGVMAVIDARRKLTIEVATFRRDAAYSDGRHPDAVAFSDAEHDAQRRDFTINGLFYDPVRDQTIDYVGGLRDLQTGWIRAIGTPRDRFSEDRLRMLRAVRFAVRFDFQIERQTHDAIFALAAGLSAVSRERIGNELRLMFAHPRRGRAFADLRSTGLWPHVWPAGGSERDEAVASATRGLQRLESPHFETAIALLIRTLRPGEGLAQTLRSNWKLSNAESAAIGWMAEHVEGLIRADQHAWSHVQPQLLHAWAAEGVALGEALSGGSPGLELCRQRLAWPADRLDPPRWVRGEDLAALGLPAGPRYAELLAAVRPGSDRWPGRQPRRSLAAVARKLARAGDAPSTPQPDA